MRASRPRLALAGVLATCWLAACAAPPVAVPTARKSVRPAASAAPRTEASPTRSTSSPSPGAPAPSAAPFASPTPFRAGAAPSFGDGPAVAGQIRGADGLALARGAFQDAGDVQVLDDGTIYLASPEALWRLRPGEPIARLAGPNRAAPDDVDGRNLRDVHLAGATNLFRDDGVDLLVAPHGHLWRVAPDGTITALWRAEDLSQTVDAVVPRADGAYDVLVATSSEEGEKYAWWRAKPGLHAAPVREASREEFNLLARATKDAYVAGRFRGRLGATRDGRLVIRTAPNYQQDAYSQPAPRYALDPAPVATTPAALDDGLRPAGFQDAQGHQYNHDRQTGRVVRLGEPPEADAELGTLPPGVVVDTFASTPDGAVLALVAGPRGTTRRLFRLADGVATVLAGGEATTPAALTETAMALGVGLLADADGLVATDYVAGRILRLRPGQPVEVLYGDPAGEPAADGADARAARLVAGAIAREATGDLVALVEDGSVVRIGADGVIHRLYAGRDLWFVATTPAGKTYVAAGARTADYRDVRLRLLRLDGAGGAEVVGFNEEAFVGLATTPDGEIAAALHERGPGKATTLVLKVMDAEGRVREVGRTQALTKAYLLAVDPAGRWWFSAQTPTHAFDRLLRVDPATGEATAIAGFDTPQLGAGGEDASLIAPRGVAFGAPGEAFVADDHFVFRVTY